MSMICFPYGFPTGYAPSPRGSSRIWPRCTNAEPGSYGQECGEPAGFIGSKADGGHVIDLGARTTIGWTNTNEWLAAALTGEDPDA